MLVINFPLEKLDAVILSHYHADHIADVGCLQYAALVNSSLGKSKTVLPIYGPERSQRFQELTFENYTAGIAVRSGETVELAGQPG